MSTIAKAWAAFTAFVLLIIGTELGVDSKWYAYAVSALAVAAVFVIPNKPAEGGEEGNVDVTTLVVCVFLLILVLILVGRI